MNKATLLDTTFEHLAKVSVLTELPAFGPRVLYVPDGDSRGGRDGLIVDVQPERSDPWIGVFAFGHLSPRAVTMVYTCPRAQDICVIARGKAYLSDTESPRTTQLLTLEPVMMVQALRDVGLLLLVGFTEIVALGDSGEAWRTGEISWDGLEISRVESGRLLGTAWDAPAGRKIEFGVDLRTGTTYGGASPHRT